MMVTLYNRDYPFMKPFKPFKGKVILSNGKYEKLLTDILKKYNCISTGLNSGGRYYLFQNGACVTVPNMGFKEDYKELKNYFNKTTPEPVIVNSEDKDG